MVHSSRVAILGKNLIHLYELFINKFICRILSPPYKCLVFKNPFRNINHGDMGDYVCEKRNNFLHMFNGTIM